MFRNWWFKCCIILILILILSGAVIFYKNELKPLNNSNNSVAIMIMNPMNNGIYRADSGKHFNFTASDKSGTPLTITANLTFTNGLSIYVRSGDPFPTIPGEYKIEIKATDSLRNKAVELIEFTIQGYTVSIEGSNYVARTQTGTVVALNQDFAAMMNTLNGLLEYGDVVLIKNGEYLLTKAIRNTDNDGITYRGEGNTILKASASNTDAMFIIYSGEGGMYPTNCIVENIIFDANFNTVISPTVLIGGFYNTVRNCYFINTIQYGLNAWKAHNFTFVNNRVEKAQYGISSGGNNEEWCSGGLIANNYITDSSDCGVKLRWIKDTLVTNNTIDTAYITWNVAWGSTGIQVYHGDGPTRNITISNNIIFDSAKNKPTTGIGVSYDNLNLTFGITIINNQISDCYDGITTSWKNVLIKDNKVTNTRNIGIKAELAPDTIIESNTVQNGGISICAGSARTIIRLNNITGGDHYWRIDGNGITIYNDDTSYHSDNCIVDTNTIRDTRRYGIQIYDYLQNKVIGTLIKNNDISGSTYDPINDNGQNTVIENNHIH